MTHDELNTGVELSTVESWAMLREAPVGRLAVVFEGNPEIFPLTHLIDQDCIVFRTDSGSKLAGAAGCRVAFEVDGYDRSTSTAWSVVVKGEAELVESMNDLLKVIELPLVPWHPAPKPHFLRIKPDVMTGLRFDVQRDQSARPPARTAHPLSPARSSR
jgi:hypothetical protein